MTSAEQRIVRDWHTALNAGDIVRLQALCSQDIEVGGPRGSGRGVDLLREWVERANIQLLPERVEQQGNAIIVEQRAAWSGGEPQTVASLFELREGRVARVIRFPDFDSAREAARA